MTIPSYTITSNGTAFSSVISFNSRQGRANKTDVYGASGASFTVRNPGSIPVTAVMGALIFVKINTFTIYAGYITNIEYEYGIKSSEDTATITLEGYLSFLGRGYLNGFTLTGGTTGAEAQRVGTALTGSAKTVSNQSTKSLTDTSSYTGAAQNIITTLVAMEQGRLLEGATQLYVLGRDVLTNPTLSPNFLTNFKMTDVLPVSSGISYDSVKFASLDYNYFTQVTVAPASVATQFAGTGSRNYQISTYDPTTSQASNLALYTLGEFNTATSVPVSISTRNSLSWNFDPADMISYFPVGWMLPIAFRGTTYNTVIEGWSISGSVDDVRYTFFLSGQPQTNFLRLNDTVYGRLDFNKLGF